MSNLAGLSLEDPGHNPVEYASHDGKKPAALSRTESHDRIAPIQGLNSASFEEYIYWAKIQREEEEELYRHGIRGSNPGLDHVAAVFQGKNPLKVSPHSIAAHSNKSPSIDSDGEKGNGSASHKNELELLTATKQFQGLPMEEAAKLDARRNLRLAGAATITFLITTDILGPNAAPYAMSQTGFATGNILYFIMGCFAAYAALLLMQIFGALDSARFPVKTYSDLAERLLGKWARHIVTLLQSIQLIVSFLLFPDPHPEGQVADF